MRMGRVSYLDTGLGLDVCGIGHGMDDSDMWAVQYG